jgi:hypothetical protein
MPAPENENGNRIDPCPEEKRENFHLALDRALTSAERVHEQVQVMRTRLDIWLMLDLLAVAFALIWIISFIIFLQTAEPKSPAEPSSPTLLVLLRLLVAQLPPVIVVVFALRYRGRLKAAYARDSAYVEKVAEVLREAVKPDIFPTRLEWHLFQMRLSRFDIGSGNKKGSTSIVPELDNRSIEAIRYIQGRSGAPASEEATTRP